MLCAVTWPGNCLLQCEISLMHVCERRNLVCKNSWRCQRRDQAGRTLLSEVYIGEPLWPWVESQVCVTTWLLGSSFWKAVLLQVVDHIVFRGLSSAHGTHVVSVTWSGRIHQHLTCEGPLS